MRCVGVVLVLCWCGVGCVSFLFFSLFPLNYLLFLFLFLSSLSFFSFSLSLSLSLSKHCVKNRSTNKLDGSLPHPLPSLLPSPSSSSHQKGEDFLLCVVLLFLSIFLLSLSFFSLLSSLLFSLFSSSFFSLLFSPPNTMERTDQPTRRPTSRHSNVIWRTAGAQQSVLSLLPSPPPPLPIKKKRTSYYRNISGEEFIFITVLN